MLNELTNPETIAEWWPLYVAVALVILRLVRAWWLTGSLFGDPDELR